MRLIVGLGNPGSGYKYTRHNVGFMVMDNIARTLNIRFKKDIRLKANIAKKKDLILAKSFTFMNLSGFSVRKIIARFDILLSDLLVVCDDMNLVLGNLRLRKKGSGGGHKGLSSIIDNLQSQDFARLRVGIDTPSQGLDASSFVLSEFQEKEKPLIEEAISKASKCALEWVDKDIEKVMSKFN